MTTERSASPIQGIGQDFGNRPDELQVLPTCPWLRRFPVVTPTLPPATHTNVYVIGQKDLLVVDPASPYPEEQARLSDYLDRLPGQLVVAILLTHHHLDHVSGAGALQRTRNVPIWAHRETASRVAALGLRVDRLLDEGETLPFGPRGTQVLHTPGHAPGHLCLVDGAGAGMVVGDMVASMGTILVDPFDSGDMGVYLDSLRRLRSLTDEPRGAGERLWPAHGAAVEKGRALLDFYLRHRLLREGKVAGSLSASARTLDELLPIAYDDVSPAALGLAARSLLAHLRKLATEGRAQEDGQGRWNLPRSPL